MPLLPYKDRHLYVEILGDGKKPSLLFIHPPGMGRKVFHYQKKLSKYFTIILPDLSGHGDSPYDARKIAIHEYVKEIKYLLDFFHIDRSIIVGYSAGGIIAQEFYFSYPDRTSSIILLGGYPEVRTKGLMLEHQIGMFAVKKFPHFLAKVLAISHARERTVRNMLENHMKKANFHIWHSFYEQSLNFSCMNRLSLIKCPLLLIYGTKSDSINRHVQYYKKYVSCQTAFIKNASHQLPTKYGPMVNQIITGFVQQLEKELP